MLHPALSTSIPAYVQLVFYAGVAAALLSVMAGFYFSYVFPLIYKREIPKQYPALYYAFAIILALLSNPAFGVSLRMALQLYIIGFSGAIAVVFVATYWLHQMFASEEPSPRSFGGT